MNELSIELTDINPREFFGQNQETITLIKAHFVKLKIVARGNVIKAYGEEAQLNDFQEKIEQLTSHYARYNQMNEQIIGMVLAGDHQTAPKEFAAMDQVIVHGINGKVITAKSVNQRKIVSSAELNDLVFAIGPAGTGKTYTSVALAVRALKDKQVKRIILTRPAVEAGENLGFLPGDLKEKLDPYMQPLYDALRDMIPPEKLQLFIETGVIQIAPLAFMRGRTLDNAFVILDEAQNTTHAQMKMFLTRMGKNAKFIVTGDPGQIDLPRRVTSGLKEALLILKDVSGIGMVYLDDRDVIRHRLVKAVIEAYKHIEHQN
ncbi:MAG: PhoH family protein [Flavobacteriaceae bacterium]|nr:PhoH family protein [Flavobacteriaceae bacterium]MDP4674766.1 PhoH family protein [Flavobacteriaceae bacterium]MDP4755089.1 PhoH family protein [Flavobacteriaceae bacterium]MDP4794821.1 PhoH family protein [Flavobacteriaceae bacterium]MDP4886095.1 PhoH family protein [Flavobacteriaceae bacterium]